MSMTDEASWKFTNVISNDFNIKAWEETFRDIIGKCKLTGLDILPLDRYYIHCKEEYAII